MNSQLLSVKNNLLLNIQSSLFILLPILLITGPFLSDLAVTIIVILFLSNLINQKNLRYLNNNIFKFFLIFWAYLVLNSLLQNQNLDSLRISIFHIRFGLFVFAIIFILENNPKVLKYFFLSILFCFVILLIDGLIQFFYGQNILGYKLAEGPRVSSFFKDELILGSYVSRLLPIFLGIFFLIYNKIKIKFLIFYLLIFYLFLQFLIIISGERSALFYFILSSFFIFIFVKNFKKIKIFTFLFSISMFVLVLFFNSEVKHRIITLTLIELGYEQEINLSNLLDKKDKTDLHFFSSHHTNHYTSALKMFKQNMLFGVGVKNFRVKCKEAQFRSSETGVFCSSHPHNTYLQLMAETGLVGLIYILSLVIIFFFYLYKHILFSKKKSIFFLNFEICLMASILITLWPFVPTGNFFNNWLNVFFHIPIGLIIWSNKNSNFTNIRF